MKGIIILAFVFLAGCGTYTPLEQLEREALVSGDWSLVEQRERIISRANARPGAHCPDGTLNYCESRFGEKRCQCVSMRVVRSTLVGN
jgi:hypothetical protein